MQEEYENLKEKTISGLFWRFGERITAQGISFIVSIVLARILLPEQYGIVAIVTIFINLANVFVTSGLGTSLVQKKEADELDFSTMFWASIGLSLILYLIIFTISPIIAKIYNNELLTTVIRVMGLKIPLAAINSIQQAYVQRKMIFKKFFFSTIIGTIISAFVGILMALKGCGVWALVGQYLTNSVIDTLVLFVTVNWRPHFKFSIKRFKVLFEYGWKIMASSFIGTVFDQLRGLIIGIRYSSSDLAFNNKGEQIPSLLSNNINTTIESVLFSSISKVQDDKEKVKNTIRRLMKVSSFIIMPLLFEISAIADTLITILLTDKWSACVPYLRIVCIQQAFGILGTVNMQAIKAIGKSDITLKLEFIKKPIYLLILLVTMNISPFAMCVGNAFYAIIGLVINSKPNEKYLNYSLREQIADTVIYFIVSLLMEGIVMLVGMLNINIYILLVLQVIFGMMFYVMISVLLKLDSFFYVLDVIKNFLKNNNKRRYNEKNF